MDPLLFKPAKKDDGVSGLALFDPPAQRHSPESVAAAERIKPHLSRLQSYALFAVGKFWETTGQYATDHNIAAYFVKRGWERERVGSTARPRRIELEAAGLIERDRARDGCATWKLTDAGKLAYLDLLHPDEAE